MDGELLAAIIFYLTLGLIIYVNRKKFTIIGKIIIAYKTKKPIALMNKLSKYSRFWKIYGTICIPLTFYFMVLLVFSLVENSINIAMTPGSTPGVTPLIPGVRIPGSPLYVPLFYGLASILVMALVHEFAHGILARTEGLRVKSTGFGLFLIFPLFFVEPDEKDMARASRIKRLRIASVGAGTNIILSYLLILILSVTFLPFFDGTIEYTGVQINSVMRGYPAELANLTSGDVIIGVNGVSVATLNEFSEELNNAGVGASVNINLKDGREVPLTLVANAQNDSQPYIGVYIEQLKDYTASAREQYSDALLTVISIFFELFVWIANINFLVGIMNLLPVWGLDGGLMIRDLLSYVLKGRKLEKTLSIVYSIALAILLWNLIGPYLIV